MTKPLSVIQIDDGLRFAEYEDNSTYPVDFFIGDDVGVWTFDKDYDIRKIPHGDDSALDVGLTFAGTFRHDYDYQRKATRAFHLWLIASGYVVREVRLCGYSQGDVCEVLVFSRENYKYVEKSLETWYRGDYSAWARERLTVFRADDGRTLDVWESEDSYSPVPHGEVTAENIADYFG